MRRASYQRIDNIKIGGRDKPVCLSVVRNTKSPDGSRKQVKVCLPASSPHLRVVTSCDRPRKPILTIKVDQTDNQQPSA